MYKILDNSFSSIHEKTLRLIYNNYDLPFDRIFEKNKQKKYMNKILILQILKCTNSKKFDIAYHEGAICHQGKQI